MNDEKIDTLIEEVRKLRIRTQRANVQIEIASAGIWGLVRAYASQNGVSHDVLDYELFEKLDDDDPER